MAEAIKLKVPKDKYLETLSKLEKQIDSLVDKKNFLKSRVQDLNGDTFSGSDVQSAIDLANEEIRRTENAITKISAQRQTIQDYVYTTEEDALLIKNGTKIIQDKLPDLFKD